MSNQFPVERYRRRSTLDPCPTCGAEPGFCCWERPAFATQVGERRPVQPHWVEITPRKCSQCRGVGGYHKPDCSDQSRSEPARCTPVASSYLRNVETCEVCGELPGAGMLRLAGQSYLRPDPARLRELIATVRHNRCACISDPDDARVSADAFEVALSELESLVLPGREP